MLVPVGAWQALHFDGRIFDNNAHAQFVCGPAGAESRPATAAMEASASPRNPIVWMEKGLSTHEFLMLHGAQNSYGHPSPTCRSHCR